LNCCPLQVPAEKTGQHPFVSTGPTAKPSPSILLTTSNRRKRSFLLVWGKLQAGLCPDALAAGGPVGFGRLCAYWGKRSANPDDHHDGCKLTEECGAVCSRDPEFAPLDRLRAAPAGVNRFGHVAGFDFFDPAWCWDAYPLLPKGEFRDFWFPPTQDRKAWRRKRYGRCFSPEGNRRGSSGLWQRPRLEHFAFLLERCCAITPGPFGRALGGLLASLDAAWGWPLFGLRQAGSLPHVLWPGPGRVYYPSLLTTTTPRLCLGLMATTPRFRFGLGSTTPRLRFGVMATTPRLRFGLIAIPPRLRFGVMATPPRFRFGLGSTTPCLRFGVGWAGVSGRCRVGGAFRLWLFGLGCNRR